MNTFRVLALLALAQDPVTDRMRFEVAKAERNYVIAKVQLDAAVAALKEKIAEAERACRSVKKSYDPATYGCIETPGLNQQPAEKE